MLVPRAIESLPLFTELPRRGVLGNPASGVRHSRKHKGFRGYYWEPAQKSRGSNDNALYLGWEAWSAATRCDSDMSAAIFLSVLNLNGYLVRITQYPNRWASSAY